MGSMTGSDTGIFGIGICLAEATDKVWDLNQMEDGAGPGHVGFSQYERFEQVNSDLAEVDN